MHGCDNGGDDLSDTCVRKRLLTQCGRAENAERTEIAAVTEAAQRWERKMMNYVKSGVRRCRLRIATFLLYVGIIAFACTLQEASSITSVAPSPTRKCTEWANQQFDLPSPARDEAFTDCIVRPIAFVSSPLTRDCTEWASEQFDSSSPARDEAFIDCIVRGNPSATPGERRHQLETGDGDGDGLFDRLTTGEELPIEPDSDCPYLRVAIQSPFGSDDVHQKPMRDLFSTALSRAGFKVVDAHAMHHWWASSLTVDTGAYSAAWTILVRAVPEIGDGAIQFTSVRKTVDGREGSFSGMQSLRAFAKHQAPKAAELAAERIARELLPAAYRRCADIDATLEQTRVRLEQLRSELTEEIERVRRQQDSRENTDRLKHLKIEVEG